MKQLELNFKNKIKFEIKDGKCLTLCPFMMKNKYFKIVHVGSGYCTNSCEYSNVFDYNVDEYIEKMVTCNHP